MTLNEIIEMVKANPKAFPKGLETSDKDVKQYLALVSVEPQTDKFAKASATLVAVAENVTCKSQREVEETCDAVRESLRDLRNGCLLAVAEASR